MSFLILLIIIISTGLSMFLTYLIGIRGYEKYLHCKNVNNNSKESVKGKIKDSDKNYCGSIRYN